tara:strand:- start:608 stop:1168 length:561 start_codon:yes stop_codon:yes gene_type:complete
MAYKGNIITNKAKASAFKMNSSLIEGAGYAAGTGVDYSKAAKEGFDSTYVAREKEKANRLKDRLDTMKVQESSRLMKKGVNITTPPIDPVAFDVKLPSPNKQTNKRTKGKGRHFRTKEEGAGMTEAGVKSYRRQNPGSKLKTAVTKCDVKPGTKAYKRQKAFCSRSKSWTGERGKAARKRWCCSRF